MVKCKICGHEGKVLTKHLKVSHGLTRKQYEEKYPDSPVVSEDTHLRGVQLSHHMHTESAKSLAKKGREAYIERLSPEELSSIAVPIIEYKRSPEGRRVQSKFMKSKVKEYWEDPEYRLKVSTRISSSMKEHWSDPMYRSKMCKIFRETPRNITPSLREVRRSNMERLNNRIYNDPSYKETVCSPLWGKGANAGPRGGIRVSYYSRSERSYVFRSLWELYVAIGLDDLGYEWEYEPFTLSGNNLRYLPDFYVKSLNLILEVKPEVFIDEVSNRKRSLTLSKGYDFMYVTDTMVPTIDARSLEYRDGTVIYKYSVQRLSNEVELASALSRVGVK